MFRPVPVAISKKDWRNGEEEDLAPCAQFSGSNREAGQQQQTHEGRRGFDDKGRRKVEPNTVRVYLAEDVRGRTNLRSAARPPARKDKTLAGCANARARDKRAAPPLSLPARTQRTSDSAAFRLAVRRSENHRKPRAPRWQWPMQPERHQSGAMLLSFCWSASRAKATISQ